MKYCKIRIDNFLIYIYEKECRLYKISFFDIHQGEEQETPFLNEVSRQIKEYFNGERKEFDDFPKIINCSNLQKKIYDNLNNVKYGTTISYSNLASLVGNKNLSRIVGTAMKNNPFPIIWPCHRVIKNNGNIGYYNGPEGLKEYLLKLENSLY